MIFWLLISKLHIRDQTGKGYKLEWYNLRLVIDSKMNKPSEISTFKWRCKQESPPITFLSTEEFYWNNPSYPYAMYNPMSKTMSHWVPNKFYKRFVNWFFSNDMAKGDSTLATRLVDNQQLILWFVGSFVESYTWKTSNVWNHRKISTRKHRSSQEPGHESEI